MIQEPNQETLDRVYDRRFSSEEARRKSEIWRVIVAYLERFIPDGATVLDVACDRGEFINQVKAGEKWAADVRDVSSNLEPNVSFRQADGLELDRVLPNDHFDVIFMSNYLEHLRSGDDVVTQLQVANRLLKPGGIVIVLQPNIRLIGSAYWDFIDHSVALTEKSLVEAAELAGLETVKVIRRFLPYTTKSGLPQSPALVRAYLALPFSWRFLGKQTLYVGRRP